MIIINIFDSISLGECDVILVTSCNTYSVSSKH